MKLEERPVDSATALELLSSKLGFVLLVLGAMHFLNILIFSRFRRSALLHKIIPPVTPDFSLRGNV